MTDNVLERWWEQSVRHRMYADGEARKLITAGDDLAAEVERLRRFVKTVCEGDDEVQGPGSLECLLAAVAVARRELDETRG